MLRGLSTTPKLFVKKIILEDGSPTGLNPGGYIDLYTDAYKESEEKAISKKLKCTLEFEIKFKYPAYLQNEIKEQSSGYISFQNEIKTLLLKSAIKGYVYDEPTLFKNFLMLKPEKQEPVAEEILNSSDALLAEKSAFGTSHGLIEKNIDLVDDLDNYTYYDDGVPYVSIPQICTFFYEKINEENNPNFLASVFALLIAEDKVIPNKKAGVIMPGTLSSEIIFHNAAPITQTGVFVISNTYALKGEEKSLFETTVFTDAKDKDPITGIPLGATKLSNDVEEVNKVYGAPGDIWVGPIHWHKYTKEGDPNSGTLRPMGGALHDPNSPHPYLEYVLKANKKIVDFRSINAVEKLFVYNSNDYEKILSQQTIQSDEAAVKFTGVDKKNTLDELVGKQAIFSEINYSIRPTMHTKTTILEEEFELEKVSQTIEKDNIHFVFAIDKLKLIKETTALPGLMDKLIFVNSGFMNSFIENLNIFHFEIIRINKATGEGLSLITGDNDLLFSDFGAKNSIGNDISKGFRLRNKTAVIEANLGSNVSIYEFTDGEIDAGIYDNREYTYEIKLKFRDPLITFLTDRLQQVREVIKDLDELLHKSALKINDMGTFVDVYDRYQDEFNSKFVKQSLKPPPIPELPLEFTFSKNEVPVSIESAFSDSTESLLYFLVVLNGDDQLEPRGKFSSLLINTLLFTDSIRNYVMNSLRLSSTSPSLIEKVRSLMALMEDRFSKSLLLFTPENVTKKDTGFTTADYYKQTNVKNAGNHIINFNHTFKQSINLAQTKNRMNWVGMAPQEDAAKGLKVINVGEYKKLVTTNKKSLLSEAGLTTVGEDVLFSYAFVPYSNCLVHFFNREFKLVELLSPDIFQYQAIRKKLFDRITGKKNNISVPEILSFFGIKFQLPKQSVFEMTADTLQDNQQSMGFDFKDNIGQSFDPSEPTKSLSPNKIQNISPAFGSVNNPDFDWQGMPFEDYPLVLAESIINIITSENQTKDKNIAFLREEYSKYDPVLVPSNGQSPMGELGIFSNKSLPYEINLFSTQNVATADQSSPPFSESYVKNGILNMLFAQDGDINHDNYPLMMLFLGLFGKVYYLDGFQAGKATRNLTPSSFIDRTLIKSMIWTPLTNRVLENLPLGKQLYCRIELFDGGGAAASLLDKKVINLFKKFYTYNEYFFIKAGTTIASGVSTTLDSIVATSPDSKNIILNIANQEFDLPTVTANGINTLVGDTQKMFTGLQKKTTVTPSSETIKADENAAAAAAASDRNMSTDQMLIDIASKRSKKDR